MLKEVDKALKQKGKGIKMQMKREIEGRCEHRHSEESHPNCFRQGRLKKIQWWKEGYSIAFLDIETSHLKANLGFMLSWSIKYRNGKLKHDLITKDDIMSGDFDKRIVGTLLEELDRNIDIAVTYYGTGFDIPFLRSRVLHWGHLFPDYGSKFHFDLYYRVRSLLKLHRNSLDSACAFFGIKGKTPIRIETWNKARYGDKKALKEVMVHNDGDVKILEELFSRLEDYSKWTKRSL